MEESASSSSEGPSLSGRSFPSPTNRTLGPEEGPTWYRKYVFGFDVSVFIVQYVVSVRSTKKCKSFGKDAN